jgi:ABC-type dipeptide/oligopeptide/nickel transport system permease component
VNLTPSARRILITVGNAVVTLLFIVLIVFGMMKAVGAHVPAGWLGHTLTGNLGFSPSNNEPARDAIFQRLPETAKLIGLSWIAAIITGFFLVALSKQVPPMARSLIVGLALPLRCLPYFWIVPLVVLLAVRGLPATTPPTSLLLGAIVLALCQIQAVSDYVDSPQWNWLGLFRICARRLPGVIAAAILVEMFFAIRGEGLLFNRAFFASDINAIAGLVLCGAAVTLLLRVLVAADV